MNIEMVIQIGTQALLTVMYVVGPPLLAAMGVGIFIAIMQAATQIQETSLTFVPKVVAVGVTILFTGRWGLTHLTAFVKELMQRMEGMAL